MVALALMRGLLHLSRPCCHDLKSMKVLRDAPLDKLVITVPVPAAVGQHIAAVTLGEVDDKFTPSTKGIWNSHEQT